jgi:hypothetical protein
MVLFKEILVYFSIQSPLLVFLAAEIVAPLLYASQQNKKVALHELLQRMSDLVLIFVETKRIAECLDEFVYWRV